MSDEYPEKMSHGTVGSRVQELSQRADLGSNTKLDNHINTLHEINNQLDRACMNIGNLLGKLRGHLPEEAGNVKAAQDPTVMDALNLLDTEIMQKVQIVNTNIEELRELI